VQYCAFDDGDIEEIAYDDDVLHLNNYKFMFKNKCFQINADLNDKTRVALRTFDLDFVKKYIEEFKPDVNDVLTEAAYIGFNDAVKLFMPDYRVEPSKSHNEALINAAGFGHLEIVQLILSYPHVVLSMEKIDEAIELARTFENSEIVKVLCSHYYDFVDVLDDF
jgi:hypothetical protein